MSNNLMTRFVVLERMVRNNAMLQGYMPISYAEQALDILLEKNGGINVELLFSKDPSGFQIIKGTFTGQVHMKCQRCLESLLVNINSQTTFAAVRTDEEAKNLPDNYEPIIVNDKKIDLYKTIEEELILNLPLIPLHENKSCFKQAADK